MSVAIINLLKAISVHHEQIHITRMIRIREERQHIGLKTVSIVEASQRIGRDQLLLADDVEQQHANHYADTKPGHRKHDLKGAAHQGRNGEKCQGSIDGLLL